MLYQYLITTKAMEKQKYAGNFVKRTMIEGFMANAHIIYGFIADQINTDQASVAQPGNTPV